jgi:hypothetical protein
MKALFAAVVASASLLAGVGVNADSQAATPAVETLVAHNEVQAQLAEEPGDNFIVNLFSPKKDK